MRRIIPYAVALWLTMVSMASAENTARCGLSAGIVGGVAVNTLPELKDEFNFLGNFEAEAKYYIWGPFSIAGAIGYIYAEGRPNKAEWQNQWVNYDGHGVSFIREGTFLPLVRIEIGRNWRFNPYLGGGAGAMYHTIERKGAVGHDVISASDSEWTTDFLGLVGMDVMFGEFFALRTEARWTFVNDYHMFTTEEHEMGTWNALAGIQIYF